MFSSFNQRLLLQHAAAMAVVTALLAIIGPFGSYNDLDLPTRLVYWAILVVGVGSLMIGTIYQLRLRDSGSDDNLMRHMVLGCALAAVPGSAIVLIVHEVLRPPGFAMTFSRILLLWVEVWVMGMMIGVFEIFLHNIIKRSSAELRTALSVVTEPTTQERSAAPHPEVTQIYSLMHKRLAEQGVPGSDIISLSMQDHYVEISTDNGAHLALMRMTDAIAELAGVPGLRVHRSHWVAYAHMKSLKKSRNRWFLLLSDGREVPVSQTYVDEVEAALKQAHSAA